MADQVSLLDEILNEKGHGTGGRPCSVALILESLPKDEAKGLREALANPSIKSTHITVVLNRRGFDINSHTVQRHRRVGGCSCERGE